MKIGGSESLRDWLWPHRHKTYWTADRLKKRTDDEAVREFLAELHVVDAESAEAALSHAEAIARTASDRASAAERRATTIAGAVAIAASLTLSGAGLVLDATKLPSYGLRLSFAITLAFTTTLFVLSAIHALRALVRTRVWNWSLPKHLPVDPAEPVPTRIGLRAAHLLDDFSRNWEIAVLKDRAVDRALWCLAAALIGVVGLAIVVLLAVV